MEQHNLESTPVSMIDSEHALALAPGKLSMLVTDLDGTLLPHGRGFNDRDLRVLKELGQKGIRRVIATGRNLLSVHQALAPDFPVDHVVFSSGAGILDWREQRLIFHAGMDAAKAANVSHVLDQRRWNHMIHRRVPHNHWFWYRGFTREASDFFQRLRRYRGYARIRPQAAGGIDVSISQFVVIIPPLERRLLRLRCVLGGRCQLIRATSPLDQQSMWIEIMPAGVSKATAVIELCRRMGIPLAATVGLGNDYNDLDMLRCVGYAAVTADAPGFMRREFSVVRSGKKGILGAFLHRIGGWERSAQAQ